MSGDLGGPAVVPLTSSEIAEFAEFLEGGESARANETDAPLTRESLLRVKRSCDILGVPRAVVARRARAERFIAPAWMASVSAEAWRAERRRSLWRTGRLASDDFVVRIESIRRERLSPALPESHFLWGRHEDRVPAPEFSVKTPEFSARSRHPPVTRVLHPVAGAARLRVQGVGLNPMQRSPVATRGRFREGSGVMRRRRRASVFITRALWPGCSSVRHERARLPTQPRPTPWP